jgi:hypothetical protein
MQSLCRQKETVLVVSTALSHAKVRVQIRVSFFISNRFLDFSRLTIDFSAFSTTLIVCTYDFPVKPQF